MVWAALCVVVMGIGATRLSGRIEAAGEDRRRALEIGPEAVRRVEARVGARRSRRFGDEVELASVRAVDGGSPVPRRFLMGLPAAGRSSQRTDELLRPGNKVRLALRMVPIRSSRNPGARDFEAALARTGVAVRASILDPAWVVEIEDDVPILRDSVDRILSGARRARDAWKSELGSRLREAGDASGLVRALGLGDRSELATPVSADFRRLGLSHLLAVSGLHVGLVAGLAAWLVGRVLTARVRPGLDPSVPVVLISVGAAGCYAWFTGGSVSAQRAGWGLAVLLGLVAWRRSIAPIEVLAWVGLGLVLAEPARVFDIGTRLSFAACLGLIVGGVWSRSAARDRAALGEGEVPRSTRAGNLRRWGIASLRTSAAAGFGTAPILAASGIPIALWAPVANLVAIPLTGLFVLPGSLAAAALMGAVEPLRELPSARAPLASTAAVAIDRIVGLFFSCIDAWLSLVSWCVEAIPAVGSPVDGWPLGVAVGALTGLLLLRRNNGALLDFLMVSFCWGWIVFFGAPPRVDLADEGLGKPRVWFFDVGQGDAALVQGEFVSVLIDTGGGPADGSGGRGLVRSLSALGVRRLEVLVLTHADLDHRGGAARVLEEFPVDELWLPVAALEDPGFQQIIRVAEDRGTRIVGKNASSFPTRMDDLGLKVLWPPASFSVAASHSASQGTSRNAGSVVLRVEVQDLSVLFLADVDREIEERLMRADPDAIRVDLLKVSHHGSRGGSRPRFLSAVGASHAIVSAPCSRRRGLPNLSTLASIRESGSRLWWTGRDGAILAQPGKGEESLRMRAWAMPRTCEA